MAVSAADITLGDLAEHGGPRSATVCVSRDIGDLVIAVIELENDDVRLAAIDARVPGEITNDVATDLLAPRSLSRKWVWLL